MTEYTIKNKRANFYLPSVPMWILDDLHLKTVEAMLYSMILTKGFMTWNYDYIGSILGCHGKTVYRMIYKFKDLDIINMITKTYGGKPRVVVVAKYTEKGKRSTEELNNLLRLGIEKLDSYYKN